MNFEKLTTVLNRRLQRTRKPFDLFGLYRAVTRRGGFVTRPLARRNLSMVEVFREMRNHYENHTYTDIGTLLLNTYETHFLEYEREHPQDLEPGPCPGCGELPPEDPITGRATEGPGRRPPGEDPARRSAAAVTAATEGGGGNPDHPNDNPNDAIPRDVIVFSSAVGEGKYTTTTTTALCSSLDTPTPTDDTTPPSSGPRAPLVPRRSGGRSATCVAF